MQFKFLMSCLLLLCFCYPAQGVSSDKSSRVQALACELVAAPKSGAAAVAQSESAQVPSGMEKTVIEQLRAEAELELQKALAQAEFQKAVDESLRPKVSEEALVKNSPRGLEVVSDPSQWATNHQKFNYFSAVLNRIHSMASSKDEVLRNSESLEQLIEYMDLGPSFSEEQLKFLRQRVISKLVGGRLVIMHLGGMGIADLLKNNRVVANEIVAYNLVKKLSLLIGEGALYPLKRKHAVHALSFLSRYNLYYNMKKSPVVKSLYKLFFHNYIPKNASRIKDIMLVFYNLSEANVKVPQSWHGPSMSWLVVHKRVLSITQLVSIYQMMLSTGVPPSVVIEDYVFNHLSDHRELMSKESLYFIFENMAKALLAPSVTMKKSEVEPHFMRIHEAIRDYNIQPKDSFLIRLFYMNAIYRLKLIDESLVDFIHMIMEVDESVVQSGLESKAEAVIKERVPDAELQREVMIFNGLPPVDLLEMKKKWIIEVDGPHHDTLLFYDDGSGGYIFRTISKRDLDRVYEEIYTEFDFKFVRINYMLLRQSPAEIKQYLERVLELK